MENKYSIGIDVEHIERFDVNDKILIKKIFIGNEITYFEKLQDKEDQQRYMAKIWSLKEAIFKSNNDFNFSMIEIIQLDSGKLICKNFPELSISISYCNKTITAVALYENRKL